MECSVISQQCVHVDVCMCTELGAHTHAIMFLYLRVAHGSVKCRIFYACVFVAA